jgi:hypothetical protein
MTHCVSHRPARSSRSTRALLARLSLAVLLAGCADGVTTPDTGLQPAARSLSLAALPCDKLAAVPPTALARAPGLAPCRIPIAIPSNVLLVNGAATGANNGTSWADAYTDLQSALVAAIAGQEIWVAAGTYKPSSTGDRAISFALKSGVGIYGGFAGTESQRTQRNWNTKTTVLSGDLDGDDGASFANNFENSFHVVTGDGTDNTAVLDGFTISGGNANGDVAYSRANSGGGMLNQSGSPTLTNLTISGNWATFGGGILNRTQDPTQVSSFPPSSPVLTNVTISGNWAASYGGGMYNSYVARPTLTNVTISGNATRYGGGGMYNNEASPTLTNVTISGNTAGSGGGMYNINFSSPQIRNSILWGNGNEIFNYNAGNYSSPSVSYSTVAGGCPARFTTCTSVSSADPLFTNPAGGDYTLQAGSPAIDAGSNSFIPSGVTTDLAGNARIVNGTVDQGAYERQ